MYVTDSDKTRTFDGKCINAEALHGLSVDRRPMLCSPLSVPASCCNLTLLLCGHKLGPNKQFIIRRAVRFFCLHHNPVTSGGGATPSMYRTAPSSLKPVPVVKTLATTQSSEKAAGNKVYHQSSSLYLRRPGDQDPNHSHSNDDRPCAVCTDPAPATQEPPTFHGCSF